MDPAPDELAGIVDIFGGLTREELVTAVENLAARQGSAFDPAVVDHRIEEGLAAFVLLAVNHEGETVLVAGPVAFTDLPEHGDDLPHMMDVPERSIDREDAAAAAEERLRTEAVDAIDAGDEERMASLLDLCYEIDAWAAADLSATRERLDDALSG